MDGGGFEVESEITPAFLITKHQFAGGGAGEIPLVQAGFDTVGAGDFDIRGEKLHKGVHLHQIAASVAILESLQKGQDFYS